MMRGIKVQPLDMAFTILDNLPLPFSPTLSPCHLPHCPLFVPKLLPSFASNTHLYNSPYFLFFSPLLNYTSLLHDMHCSAKILYIFVVSPPWYQLRACMLLRASFSCSLPDVLVSPLEILSSYCMDILVCCHDNPELAIKLRDASGRDKYLLIFPPSLHFTFKIHLVLKLW